MKDAIWFVVSTTLSFVSTFDCYLPFPQPPESLVPSPGLLDLVLDVTGDRVDSPERGQLTEVQVAMDAGQKPLLLYPLAWVLQKPVPKGSM